MSVDRYTKLVLTVIAVCLVWLSAGGPSLLTPVSAQQDDPGNRVILAGWVDQNGNVRQFPNPYQPSGNRKPGDGRGAIPSHALPVWNP